MHRSREGEEGELLTRSKRRTSTTGGHRRRTSKIESRRASWIRRRCRSGMVFADVVRPPSSSRRARHLTLGPGTELTMSLGWKSSGKKLFEICLANHHFVTPFHRSIGSHYTAKAAHHCSPVVRILENWTGYAPRPPRHRASSCTSEETGRMLSSRSVRPSTTRGISLRSIPMSRSRRSSMPRRVSIIFRRCQWWNAVRSQRRNAPGLRLR